MTTKASRQVKLTAKGIENLRPGETAYLVKDAEVRGLSIRVAPSGLKTWDLQFRVKGRPVPRRVSLGRVDDRALAAARSRAREIVAAARQGIDLLHEEAVERERVAEAARLASLELTVEKLIERYVAERVRPRLRTADEIERRLRRALDAVLRLRARGLTRSDLRPLFRAVAAEGKVREAEKRRQVVGAMFAWALSEDLVDANPVAGIAAFSGGDPRERVLGAEELARFWQWLPGANLPDGFADVLRLQLLLGARAGEVGGMARDEIDTAGEVWVWTLPAARSKNKAERRTPLVGLAREIIARRIEARPQDRLLFTNERGGPVGATHLGNALNHRRRAVPISDLRTHDLRRTLATGMSELGISLETIAAVVGHEAGGEVPKAKTLVRHYVHGDLLERKAAALTAWDVHVRRTVERQAGSNVVPLRRG